MNRAGWGQTADLAAYATAFFYACYGVMGNDGIGLRPKIFESTVATRLDIL
jgi:hypothetical protein